MHCVLINYPAAEDRQWDTKHERAGKALRIGCAGMEHPRIIALSTFFALVDPF
jgi:hypothetical protein